MRGRVAGSRRGALGWTHRVPRALPHALVGLIRGLSEEEGMRVKETRILKDR